MFRFLQQAKRDIDRALNEHAAPIEHAINEIISRQSPETQRRVHDFHSELCRQRDQVLPQVDDFLFNLARQIENRTIQIDWQNPYIPAQFVSYYDDENFNQTYFYDYSERNNEGAIYGNPLGLEERIEFRRLLIQRCNENQANGWGENESIMRSDVTAHFFESMNRLETTYPEAVSNTEANFNSIINFVHGFDAGLLGPNGEWKKAHAIQNLSDIAHNFRDIGEWSVEYLPLNWRDPQQLLNMKQVLSLSWTATQDQSVFTTEEARTRQNVQFILLFAENQRAHNDSLEGGQINFDPNSPSSPSCTRGQVIRALEPLNLVHPDVQLHANVPAPTSQEIATSMLQYAQGFHFTASSALISGETVTVDDSRFAETPAYEEFRAGIRNSLVTTYPGLRRNQLEAALAPEILSAALDQINIL